VQQHQQQQQDQLRLAEVFVKQLRSNLAALRDVIEI
jgi:hypothetical protein